MLLRLAYLTVTNTLACPDTVLRWHRDLIKKRHATRSTPKRRGRLPTVRSVRVLVLRLVRENPEWGYPRVHGPGSRTGTGSFPDLSDVVLADAGIVVVLNAHRPHRGLNGAPLRPAPEPLTNHANSISFTSSDEADSTASSTSTNMPYDLHGRSNRHLTGMGTSHSCRTLGRWRPSVPMEAPAPFAAPSARLKNE